MSKTIGSLLVRISGNADGLFKSLRQAETAINRAGKNMQRIGDSMMKMSAPFVALGGISIKMAMDFETSMNKMVSLVGLTREEVEKMGPAVKKMAADTGISANKAADALFFITSAGLRGKDAMDALEMSLKASASGLGEVKVVADLVTSAVNAYGSDVLSASNATDVLAAAVREGKLESEDLAASIGQVLPLASNLGITFDQVGAAMAGMSRTGTDAATAATQLKGIMATLLKPSKEGADTLAAYGLSAAGLREQIRDEGLLATLQTLTDRFAGNDEAIATVFGNIRALTGVMDMMGASADTTVDIFASLENATGSLDHAFETTSETAGFKFNQAMESARNVAIDLGIALLPIFNSIIARVKKWVEWIGKLDPAIIANVIKIMAIVGAIGAAVKIIGVLITTYGSLIGIITKARYAYIAFSKAVTVLNAIMIANPIGAIITGVAALIAVVVMAIKKYDSWGAALLMFMGPIGVVVNGFKALQRNWDSIVKTFKTDGIIAGLKRVGIVLLDTLLYPVQQLLELASRIPGIGNLAAGAAEKIENLRKRLDLNTDRPKKDKIEDDWNWDFDFEWQDPNAGVKPPKTPTPTPGGAGGAGGGGMIEEIGRSAEAALKPLDALNQSVVSLSSNQINLSENIRGVIDNLVEVEPVAETIRQSFERMAGTLDEVITRGTGIQQVAAGMAEGLMSAAMQGASSLKSLASAAIDAGAKIIRSQIMQGVAGYVASALKSIPFPFGAIAAGIAGAAAVTLFNGVLNKVRPPKLAKGGMAFGETMAVVGDNPNARFDPEVISPLSKLKSMLGNMQVNVNIEGAFHLRGTDLVLAVERATPILNRQR